jgi:hypothetical protein
MINAVRNTVLAVLNKNNYGYISPQDFNLYAKQAQMELFDEYFSQFNKSINMENARQSGTGYAAIGKKVAENLETFLTNAYLWKAIGGALNNSYNNNSFYVPSFYTTGDDAYMINDIITYPVTIVTGTNTNFDAFNLNKLIDSNVNFITLGVQPGDVVSNTTTNVVTNVLSVINANTILLEGPAFGAAGDGYGVFSGKQSYNAEKVLADKIFMLNRSNLTAPSTMYPAYVYNSFPSTGSPYTVPNILTLYPSTINTFGQVQANYFRFPKDPKWTYITLFNGEPSFDQSQPDYQDFEIQGEDEYKLVMKILQYCGISIREQEVTQFGMAQEQHEQPTFSQQQ